MKYLFIGGAVDGERLEVTHDLPLHVISENNHPTATVTDEPTLATKTVSTHRYKRTLLTDGTNDSYRSVKTFTVFLHERLTDPVTQLIAGYVNRTKLIEVLECFEDMEADQEYYDKYGEPASLTAEKLLQQLTKQ